MTYCTQRQDDKLPGPIGARMPRQAYNPLYQLMSRPVASSDNHFDRLFSTLIFVGYILTYSSRIFRTTGRVGGVFQSKSVQKRNDILPYD